MQILIFHFENIVLVQYLLFINYNRPIKYNYAKCHTLSLLNLSEILLVDFSNFQTKGVLF